MASPGYLESLVNTLPQALRPAMLEIVREGFGQLRFGAPADSNARCENFGGALVPFTTSSVANREVAIAHGLGRVPRLAIPLLALDTVNATVPQLTVTRAADATFLYLGSPVASAATWIYVE
jgi:hypothetical protein